ncbi:FecCD family ABC transporter permease [Aquipuribacter sp. MA13-6]|uniref:FecCD family ABC transporter permease n=1 Tax=unclassified Aquipuribacter TaxID=2635084 RepID=UPI003EE88108
MTAPTRTPVDVAAPPPPGRGARRLGAAAVLPALGVVLAVVTVVAVGRGQLAIAPAEVLGLLARWAGLTTGPVPTHPQAEAVLLQVRLPRVALAVLVGGALAAAGAVMQGVFGNPLAEPAVVGVSAGAAVGASTVIVTGTAALGGWSVAAGAFVGGLLTTLLVYWFSRSGQRTEVVTLVLTGIAVNAVAGAAIAFLTFVADPQAREQLVFWQLGSLNGARWQSVLAVLPLVVVGLVASGYVAHRLDLLSLGERPARHLGVDVERLRLGCIVVVALLVGAAVAFAGIVGFVGLVVPHLVRMVCGPGHRLLVPASALTGAVVLVLADLAARTLVPNADLPLGMLTALVGGPFFFWLLHRTRSRQGGWA